MSVAVDAVIAIMAPVCLNQDVALALDAVREMARLAEERAFEEGQNSVLRARREEKARHAATEHDLNEALRAEGIHPNALPTARKVCDALRPLVESAREADMLGRDIEAFFACCVRAMVWHRKDDPA